MKTVLVVDDELTVLEMLMGILEDAGYQVVVAGDGDEALERIAHTRPDLILSDMMMPVMDGRELCRMLANDPELAAIPFVFLSASVRARISEDCHYRAFVAKPFEIDQLLSTIEELLNSQAR